MPEFSTDTGVIYYEIVETPSLQNRPGQADKPMLVLLHNFMSTGRGAWGPLLEGLADEFRIILPDLPGHGRSIGRPPGFNHTVIAHQLAALFETIGAVDAHLAGCSSGGMIAQLLVHHDLMAPASLALVSTTHSVEPARNGAVPAMILAQFQANARWRQATANLHDPHRYDGYYEAVLLPGFRKLRGGDAIDLPLGSLADWSIPACIIHGEQDEFFPANIALRMAEMLPDSELYLFPDQSHALIFRQPWQVLARLLNFYKRLDQMAPPGGVSSDALALDAIPPGGFLSHKKASSR